ncbi:hypothetical protein IFR04_005518 [Cadophora malorum]|uniref:SGNH hydrolase n=1 Tax=Cadophora malorum TaxID=108018 RepID=A0A8H7TGQ3_9HELO|nr:hypothetical protein IFR04_005518 [Cadophora malorum]
MANLKKRLAGAVLLTVLSMMSICLLLPNSRVSSHLQKITLGTAIDNYSSLWSWHEDESSGEEDAGGGIRLVVFGDSWVDDTLEESQDQKGKSWPEVMCEEINCTSRLTFAATQPASDWPALPPTGVKTSNNIHAWAVENTRYLPHEDTNYTLPDLSAQVQAYLSLPAPKQAPKETIYVLSFGFWDIYDFARLDYAMAMNVTDRSFDEIFTQLNILYNHFDTTLYPVEVNATSRPKFNIIIPRLFDPTLTPGWVSHRPAPLSPSSVAEQQKNAVYLTERWNQMLENSMGSWMNSLSGPESNDDSDEDDDSNEDEQPITLEPSEPFQPPKVPAASEEQARTDVRQARTLYKPSPNAKSNPSSKANSKAESFAARQKAAPLATSTTEVTTVLPQKDIFYYDTPKFLLDIIVEHALEDAGLVDASGLGTGESSFVSVALPCMREVQEGEDVDGMVDVNGMLICKEQDLYLWWDAFTLGGVANGEIGKEVAERVRMGRGLRLAWENSGKTT